MSELLHHLPLRTADVHGARPCLRFGGRELSYADFASAIETAGSLLLHLGLERQDRVGIYLPKTFETATAFFAAAWAGGVFVPVNPVLKAPQVAHILRDCDVRILVTSSERLVALEGILPECPSLETVLLIDGPESPVPRAGKRVLSWHAEVSKSSRATPHRVIDIDMVSIFYTSGSTGKPKGVVLSHRNMVTGARSVAEYLRNVPDDRLLAVLPFSFDYGFSQLSTAFSTGASVVLMDYLFARDVLTMAARERVTGLAGVPPLWLQLADLEWPEEVRTTLRYITNSGGALPVPVVRKLRATLPRTEIFLMYGLTEAFRSTYLPPSEVDRRPDSIGKAIPNAEVLVLRPDGTECAPNEPGELVHRGSLVSLGYWNDPEKSAERFRPLPARASGLVLTEMAVWSGDMVRRDEEGFLYFIGRRDEMIKTSGYRVSPTEIEEAVYATGLVGDAVATGVPHPLLGQAVVIAVTPPPSGARETERLLRELKQRLPAYMVPAHVDWRETLPRNPNGKFDRTALAAELKAAYGRTEA